MNLYIVVGIAIAALGAALYFFVFKKKDSAPPAPAPQQGAPAPAWAIRFSPGMPTSMADSFDFPQSNGVHYVSKAAPAAMGTAIAMAFRIDGNAQFVSVDEPDPAHPTPAAIRLFMQRRGDPMDLSKGPSYRFWSQPVQLVTGDSVISAALTPDLWTNVNGQNDPAGFAALLGDIESVGFTFGGMFAGHGVYATGPARFTVISYTT